MEDVCAVSLQLDNADVLAIAVVCGEDVDLAALRKTIGTLVPRQFPLSVLRVEQIPRNAMGRIPRERFAKALTAQARQRIEARKRQKVN